MKPVGFWLLLPFFLIRFGLLGLLNREAIRRAAYFPPLRGAERTAYWVYQICNVAIFLYLLFSRIKGTPAPLLYAGIALYSMGCLLLALSVIYFAFPAANGFNQNGLYRISRNPMYLAYFVVFLGCVLLTQSPLLLGFVLVFQAAAHWIIRSEERWCVEQFGGAYLQYMKKVRRYL